VLNWNNYGTGDALGWRRAFARDNDMKCSSILEAVGHTPLVRLNRINQGLKPQTYVKAGITNPGASL